jgi:hypothetical protein
MKPRDRSVYFSIFIFGFPSACRPHPLRHDCGIFIGYPRDRIDISQLAAGRRPVFRLDANVGMAGQNGRGQLTNSGTMAEEVRIP